MFIPQKITKNIVDYGDIKSLGSRFRIRRVRPLLQLIQSVYKEKGQVSLIDIGGTREYWNIVPVNFLKDHCVTITIVNLYDLQFKKDDDTFHFVKADACDLSLFRNNSFDITHSNSVIEHVGDWGKMVKFSNEVKRLAPKYFIQTPNYWFPVEPHCMTLFFHWLPRPTRIWLVMNFRLGNWSKRDTVDKAVSLVESARLLNKHMVKELFHDSKIFTERFLYWPKSFVAIKN